MLQAYRAKLLLLALLVAVWLLSHPYQGIWHDASLYTVQALQRLDPAAFRHDVFFAYGSQDSFTIFTPFYGWLIEHFGINAAAIGLLAVLQVLWCVSYWALCRQFLQGRWLYLALLLGFGMSPRYYGGFEIFSYAENFLTARLAAEAVGLAAATIYLSGRRNTGLLVALVATAVHPLIGGWVAGLLFILRFGWRVSVLCSVLAAIAAFIFKPALIEMLVAPMDAKWRELVLENSPQIFFDQWRSKYWSRAATTLGLLFAVGVTTQGKARLFWLTLTAIGLSSLAMCWLGTATFHGLLPTQLQLWRILWLASALQWIALAQLAQTLWSDRTQRLWLAWLLIAWLTQDNGGGIIAFATGAAYWLIQEWKLPSASPALAKWLRITTYAALVVAIAFWLPNAVLDAGLEGGNYFRNRTPTSQLLAGIPLTQAALLPILILWQLLSLSGTNTTRWVGLGILATALLIVGAINWDQRYAMQYLAEIDDGRPENRPFGDRIKPGDTVFWPGYANLTWFRLRTAHYVSAKQVSGILFHRATALEAERRFNRVAEMALPLDELAAAQPAQRANEIAKLGSGANLRSKETLLATSSGLIHLCHDPVLDFVILGTPFPALAIAEYATSIEKLRFWLYDCKRLRQQYPDPMPEPS